MAAINTAIPIRLVTGVFRINDGSTDSDLEQRVDGSIEIIEGGYEQLNRQNKGVNQTPLEGNERRSTIRARCRLTSVASATIRAMALARDTSTGLAKLYTVTFRWEDYKGAVTGKTLAFANTWFANGCRIVCGDDYDHVEFEMESATAVGTPGTY